MISIRGAITINSDTKVQVLNATRELLNYIVEKNNMNIEEITSIIFTCTQDIKSVYPAVAAREMGIVNAGLICVNEMYVPGSLEKCIRILMLANKDITQDKVNHIYLGGAKVLRPDLVVEKR